MTNEDSTYRRIITSFAYYTKFVPISVIYLYCISAWLTSTYYEQINQDIKRKRIVKREHISNWKRSLALASELVNQLNNCFGLVLFISITHLFIYFITHSFYLMNSYSKKNQFEKILGVIHILLYFGLLQFIVYSSSQLANSVS